MNETPDPRGPSGEHPAMPLEPEVRPHSFRVLLVEGNPEEARLLKELAGTDTDLDICHVDQLAAGLAHLASQRVDAVLLDLGLPDSQGLETLLKLIASGHDVPVVVLTAPDDEATARAAVREGAQDVLVKGQVAKQALTRAVHFAAERQALQTRLRHQSRALRTLRNISRLIVRERDAAQLLEQACVELTQTRGYAHAQIYRVDGSGRITDAAGAPAASRPDRRLEGARPACFAALEVDDVLAGEALSGHCPGCPVGSAGTGCAAMVTRLECFGRRFGLLGVSCPDALGTQSDERSLLLEVARDLAFALYSREEEDRRKQAEAEREQLHVSLAQSDRLASMGLLAAGVAHEINNPMAYVLYNLESLVTDVPRLAALLQQAHGVLAQHLGAEALRELLGPAAEVFEPAAAADLDERLGYALLGSRRIRDIARGLGIFARIDPAGPALVNLRDPIESALGIALSEIKYRARVVKEFGDTAPVLASDGRLSQVFLNLFVNATHAFGDGPVEQNLITVRTWQDGARVCAEVRDTGSGIPADVVPRVFEPFFTTKAVGVGSGLGLSIVRSILAGYGGQIDVTSAVGQGTSFVIQLPAAAAVPRVAEPARASEPSGHAHQGRILVIDDETGIRRVLRRILSRHEVVEAESGQVARDLLTRDPRFDVILCDLMMPGVSGIELHRWLIRENLPLAQRLVFITGGAFTPAERAYLGTVANLRVDKPFETEALVRLVADQVAASREPHPGD